AATVRAKWPGCATPIGPYVCLGLDLCGRRFTSGRTGSASAAGNGNGPALAACLIWGRKVAQPGPERNEEGPSLRGASGSIQIPAAGQTGPAALRRAWVQEPGASRQEHIRRERRRRGQRRWACKRPLLLRGLDCVLVAGEGFEPPTFGL